MLWVRVRGGWAVVPAPGSAEGLTLVFVSHSPQQEVQSIFKAKHPMDTEITKAKVTALFMASRVTLWAPSATTSVPTLPLPLHRSSGLVPHSLKRSILILPILWELVSSTPEPPRSGACCVWSRISRPRSGGGCLH